jgi:hypothetical protein
MKFTTLLRLILVTACAFAMGACGSLTLSAPRKPVDSAYNQHSDSPTTTHALSPGDSAR